MTNFSQLWSQLSQQTPQLIPPANRLKEIAKLDDFQGLDPSLPTIDMRIIDTWKPGDNLPPGTFKSVSKATRLAVNESLRTGQAHITQIITEDAASVNKVPKVNRPFWRLGTRVNVKDYTQVAPKVFQESWLVKDMLYDLKQVGQKLFRIAK